MIWDKLTRWAVSVYRKIHEWDEASSKAYVTRWSLDGGAGHGSKAEAQVKLDEMRFNLTILAALVWFLVAGALVGVIWILYGFIAGLCWIMVWLSPFLVYWRGYAIYWRAVAAGEEDK